MDTVHNIQLKIKYEKLPTNLEFHSETKMHFTKNFPQKEKVKNKNMSLFSEYYSLYKDIYFKFRTEQTDLPIRNR